MVDFSSFAKVAPDFPVSPGAHMMTILPDVAAAIESSTSWEDAEERLLALPDTTMLEQAEVIEHSCDGWFGWPWAWVYAIGHAMHVYYSRKEIA